MEQVKCDHHNGGMSHRVFWCLLLLGELCEADINECASDPCPSESICYNFDGGYACNCSDPAVCPSFSTNVDSSPLGVSWMEIVAVAGQLSIPVIPVLSVCLITVHHL